MKITKIQCFILGGVTCSLSISVTEMVLIGFHGSCGGGATSKLYQPVVKGRKGAQENKAIYISNSQDTNRQNLKIEVFLIAGRFIWRSLLALVTLVVMVSPCCIGSHSCIKASILVLGRGLAQFKSNVYRMFCMFTNTLDLEF